MGRLVAFMVSARAACDADETVHPLGVTVCDGHVTVRRELPLPEPANSLRH